MKKIYLSLLLVLVLAQNNFAGTTIFDSIVSNGIYRKFRLYVPTIYSGTTAVPLVLNLHGYTSNSTQQQAYANFMPIADTANFLLVQPDGTLNGGNQFWNAGFAPPPPDDVMFIKDLIDSLDLIYNIDPDRVYSCGMSNGGIMSYYMACNLPGKIAAIASVTGSMLNAWFTCVPNRPFPVMEIHGTTDGTVNYYGDAVFANIDTIIKKWRIHNNCTAAPVTYSVPDINNTDNCTAVNFKYLNGNNGSSVELYRVVGGSHSWPGAFPIFSNTNQDFSASVEIWRFFRKYKLNQFITGINENYELKNVKIYPNPSSDIIVIDGIEGATLTVISIEGKKLQSVLNSNTLNIQNLQNGMYFLEISKDNYSSRVKFVKN